MLENATLRDLLAEPQSIEDLNIPQSIVIDISLRLLFNEGNVSLSRFVDVLKIPSRVIDTLLLWMQKEHLVEVSKASTELGRLGYVYTLTSAGEDRSKNAFERSLYTGPVPVPIHYYNRAIELQAQSGRQIKADAISKALTNLILPSDFHRRVGPAINSSSSLFLYGPPGNGKTTIAEAIASLIAGTDPVWLPYALTAGGYIIQVHDRLVHKPIPIVGGRTDEMGRVDMRWGLFKRPSVSVGGELQMEALDLRFDPVARIYEAPLQMKANTGMFLIDDFGRQQVRPGDLLNRWIVPLESELDYLRLQSGQSLSVPFKMLLVFSTNLEPRELVDDAFLRRIQMKVEVGSPDERLFYQIFVMVCKHNNVPFDRASFVHFLHNWYKKNGRVMQAVHPRDIVRIIVAMCEYDGIPRHLSPELIDLACQSYFVD